MKLEEVGKLARELITNHDLHGYESHFSKAVKRVGTCDNCKKIIRLSESFASKNDESKVKDIILHEIAHALDFSIGGKSKHDDSWKAIARQIGCSGSRVCCHGVFMPKFVGFCPSCKDLCHGNQRRYKVCKRCWSEGKYVKIIWERNNDNLLVYFDEN